MANQNNSETPVGSDALFGIWNPIETAPKGGGADRVDDPKWVDPPRILIAFEDGEMAICYWDYYYDEGGYGYEGHLAWVIQDAGEIAVLYHDNPIAWMPLPSLPNAGAVATGSAAPEPADRLSEPTDADFKILGAIAEHLRRIDRKAMEDKYRREYLRLAALQDPNNLEGPGPTEEERRANARAIQELPVHERFALMFGRTDTDDCKDL